MLGIWTISLVPRLFCVERAWYTLFAHAQFSQDFCRELTIFSSTNSVYQALFTPSPHKSLGKRLMDNVMSKISF